MHISKTLEEFNDFLFDILSLKSDYLDAELIDRNSVLTYINSYIITHLYNLVFPQDPSNQDLDLYNKMRNLSWISPENLNIRISNINMDAWKICIQEIYKLDKYLNPYDKILCMKNALKIAKSSIKIFGGKDEGSSYEEVAVILFYCILKATPRQMYSNINFISNFVKRDKLSNNEGFSLEIFKESQNLIKKIDKLCEYDVNNEISDIKSSLYELNLLEQIHKESILFVRELVKSKSFSNDKLIKKSK